MAKKQQRLFARGAQARVSECIKALEAVGFERVKKSRHFKVKHPVSGVAFTLPIGGGTDPRADGVFVTKVRRLIQSHQKYAS